MEALQINPFEKFGKQWALLTAGNPERYNAMTISWGGMGTLWGKPVVTVYVRPTRYTYEFMESSDFFTLSFFEEQYRKDLELLGSRSGRDEDKLALTSLTPEPVGRAAVTFREAKEVLVCRTMYRQDLVRDYMEKEIMERLYIYDEPHRMYIAEVLQILKR